MTQNVGYWLKSEHTQNFGDFLTEFFLDELFCPLGMPANKTHIIGSVISDLFVPETEGSKPVIFWGCGARQVGGLADERRGHAIISSVRGPLSASELRLGASVPQGDPAFLVPALHKLRPSKGFENCTVCIPHFHDTRPDNILKELSGCDLVLRPNLPNDVNEVRNFIDAIGASGFVLSAAMHGAVVAAAYGRPFAFWDNGNIDLPFKWQDIAALMGISLQFCTRIEIAQDHYERAIKPEIKVPSMWRSLAVAPMLFRPTGLLKALRQELSNRLTSAVLTEIDDCIEVFEANRHHLDHAIEGIETGWNDHAQFLKHEADNARRACDQARVETTLATEARDAALEQAAAWQRDAEEASQQREAAINEAKQSRRVAEEVTQQREAAIDEARQSRREADAALVERDAAIRQAHQLRREAEAAAQQRDGAINEASDLRREFILAARKRDAAFQDASWARQETQAALQKAELDLAALEESTRAQLARSEADANLVRMHLAHAEALIRAFEESTAWKLTWPLRRVAERSPQARELTRRALRVMWWTLTLQFRRYGKPAGAAPSEQALVVKDAEPGTSIDAKRADEFEAAVTRFGVDPTKWEDAPDGDGRRDKEPELFLLGTTDVMTWENAQAHQTDIGQKRAWRRPLVLIIDSVYPRPDQDSGSIDAINFIQIFLLLGYQVGFVACSEFSADSAARKAIEDLGVVCITSADYASVEEFLSEAASIIDLCFLSRVYCGGIYVEAIKRICKHAHVVFNTVDLHHLREEREARLKQDRRALNSAYGTREREFAIARLSDATIVVSEEEKNVLRDAVPGTLIHTIPLARECPGRVAGFGERRGVGFIGGFRHTPNIDAVKYFLSEIWPHVRARLPDINFYVMGSDMPDEIRYRNDPGFVAVGYVSDLQKEMEKIRLMVAPLRFGAGAKGKVASSLAHGVPCIATPIAAEGMGLTDGKTVAVATTPQMFADKVVGLYTDASAWSGFSDRGVEFIANNYSFDHSYRLVRGLLEEIRAPLPVQQEAMI